MAMLPITTRTLLWQRLMMWYSRHDHALDQPFAGIAKRDLYNPDTDTGLIDQVDDWIEAHQGNVGDTTGFNGAIQEPCKSGLTTTSKGFILAIVVLARYNPDLARQVLGG